MALFSRKKKDDALVERIVEGLSKATNAMSSTPYGGSGYATASAAMPSQMTASGGQGLLQTPGMQANPLPRPATSFGAQLGPSAPFLPAPLDPVYDDSGRALPRIWEYPVAWNLDLNQRSTPWTVLRSMADQIDIIHRAIEIKIAEITKMEWSFQIEDATIASIMAEQNCSHAKAARIARDRYSEAIDDLRKFWENPYPQLGRSFTEWMTEFLWTHFVFDGTPVYPRYNLGRKVLGFEIVDAPTIKVLLDNRGAIPEPPSPAFQQVLWGFPRGEFQYTPNSDGEFFTAPGKSDEYLRDQLAYFVRNRRTWSPYGYSAVEECVPAATLYLDRQQWMKAEYRDGATPMAFFETDSDEMDPTHLAAFERVFNDRLVGSTAERHRMKVLPRGFKPVFAPTIDERYKNEYDEYIILRICTVFGVAPAAMGIVPRSGLGGKGEHDGQAQAALTTSQKPLESFLIETINTLSRRFLGADKNITFSFDDDDSNVATMIGRAQAFQVSLQSGQMTINDVRGELNMPLYDIPEADEPFIVAGQTIQFLNGLLEQDSTGETIGMKGQENEVVSRPGSDSSNVTEEGSQGKESKGQVVESQGGASTPPVAQKSIVADELRAFGKYVSTRLRKGAVYRDFQFTTINEEDAWCFNQDVQATVKGETYTPPKGVQAAAQRALDWIADGRAGSGFTDVGRKRASDLARGAGVSMATVRRMKAYFDRHAVDKDATGFSAGEDGYPSPGRVAWDAWGGDAGYSWVKGIAGHEEKTVSSGDTPKVSGASITKRSADDLPGITQKRAIENHYAPRITKALAESFSGIDEAIAAVEKVIGEKAAGDDIASIVARFITYNNKPLASVIAEMSMDAGYVGTVNAVKEMGAGAKLSYGLARAAVKTVDWSSWTPGHPMAATNLADGMLRANLDSLDITLDGIGKTSVDRIGNSIASGVSQGFPARTIAASVNAIIADPVRSMTIAITETNRAYNLASVDQYAAAGTKQFEWIAYDTACPECAALEGAHDLSDPVPPDHPNCRCTVAAVVS